MSISTTIKTIQDIMRKDAGVDGDAQRISQLVWMFFLKIYDDREKEYELMEDVYVSPIPDRLRWYNWAADPEGITGDELLDFVNNDIFKTLKDLSLDVEGDRRGFVVRGVFEDAYNYMKSGTLMRQVVNKINEINFNKTDDMNLFGDIYEQILKDLQSAGNAGEFYTPRAVTKFMVDRVDPKLGEKMLDPACGTGGFLTATIDHLRGNYVKNVEDEATLQNSIHGVEKKPLPHLLCVTNMLLHNVKDPSKIQHDNTLARPLRDYGQKDKLDVIVTNPPFGGMEEDGIESNFPATFRTRETANLFLVLIIHLLKDKGRCAIVLPDDAHTNDGIESRIREKLLEECNLHTIVRLPSGVFSPYTNIKTNLLFFTKGEPTKDVWYYEHPYPEDYKSYSKTKPLRIEEFEQEIEWWDNREENEYAWKVSKEDIQKNGYNLSIKNPNAIDVYYGDPDELLQNYQLNRNEIADARGRLKNELISIFNKQDCSISNTLFDNFNLLIDVPDDVQKLRNLILQLTVQGKLVSQNLNDGHASVIIRRIEDRKLSVKSKNAEPVIRDEFLFKLPESWEWVRFGQIVDFNLGRTPPTKESQYWVDNGTPWVSIADMQHNDTIHKTKKSISKKAVDEIFQTPPVPAGTMLMSFKLTIGKISITGIDAFHNEAIISIYPSFSEVGAYLFKVLPILSLGGKINDAMKGKTLNSKSLTNLLIPLPPLEEQCRIVAKVDKLMALCDELEAKLNQSQTDGEKLMEAVVAEMVGA